LSSGSSKISRVNTPSVTTSMRVFADTFEPKRTRSPTVSPVRSFNVFAMRSAAARAAIRRGSSTRILPVAHGSSVQHQRHARGLAGAGRRDQYGDVRRPQRRGQRRQGFVDGKGGQITSCARCHPGRPAGPIRDPYIPLRDMDPGSRFARPG
jgi:hypothetical protein